MHFKKKLFQVCKSVIADLVDSTQRGHINSLSPHSSSTSDTSGILTRATVDDGVHKNLQGILGKRIITQL